MTDASTSSTPLASKTLTASTKIYYGVADLGIAMLTASVQFFLLFFYTDVVIIDPGLAGTALLVGKLTWDAINDPLMGYLSDRTRTRIGRRRPYLTSEDDIVYVVPTAWPRMRHVVDRHWRVALVGAGRIGLALFEYPAFRARGYDCVAIFDADPEKVGTTRAGLTIRDPSQFEDAVRDLGIELVILAVPEAGAQEMAGRAVEAGVKGILNFAPIRLNVPPRVPVEDVNLVMELEALSFAITQAEHDA